MDIDFQVGTWPVRLSRDWFSGSMQLQTPQGPVTLQDPLNPGTHFDFRLRREWTCDVGGHRVRVEKIRKLFFAGLRPQTYRIHVDDVLVVERTG